MSVSEVSNKAAYIKQLKQLAKSAMDAASFYDAVTYYQHLCEFYVDDTNPSRSQFANTSVKLAEAFEAKADWEQAKKANRQAYEAFYDIAQTYDHPTLRRLDRSLEKIAQKAAAAGTIVAFFKAHHLPADAQASDKSAGCVV